MANTLEFSVRGAGTVSRTYRLPATKNAAGTLSNSSERVVSLPAWARHGRQPEYWTAFWTLKEKLADWDRAIGTVFETDDMDAVIQHLHEAVDAAQAE